MSEKKVKRKVGGTQNDVGNPSIVANVSDSFLLEEAEALKRDVQEDLTLFKLTASDIRSHLEKIFQLKTSPDNEAKVEKLRIQICLHFLLLKKLNRLDKHRLKHAKDSVSEAKQKVDSYNLQLQNLQYEVMHLQREASKCMDFRSKDENMDLVPLEEFYKEAPESISRPEICHKDPHQENLARLQWELTQRKKLAEKCTKMEAKKKLLQQDIAKKKEKFSKIHPTLLNIIEATKPLHTELGMPLQATSVEHEGASLLPGPLYNLYVNVHAYRTAATPGQEPRLTASIEGSQEEAKTLVANSSPSEEDSAESDADDNAGPGGDGHRRRERASEKENSVLASHPLMVKVTVGGCTSSQDAEDLILEFSYLPHLQVVVVRVVGVNPSPSGVSAGDVLQGDRFLHHLLPDKSPDDGSQSPNPSNNYLLRKYGLSPSNVWGSATGLPYNWAQILGGLYYLKEEDQQESKEEGLAAIFLALQQRVRARSGLYLQLHSLERGLVPLDPSLASYFPAKVLTRLHSWTPASWTQMQQEYKGLEEWQDLGVISSQDFVYKLVLERGSAQLQAFVVVPLDYPTHTPVFLLSLSWRSLHIPHTDWGLWDLEQKVNMVARDQVEDSTLLGYQIQTLAVGLDLYLEIKEDSTVEGPKEFPLSRTVLRRTLGPGRMPPYNYLPKLGLFTHF